MLAIINMQLMRLNLAEKLTTNKQEITEKGRSLLLDLLLQKKTNITQRIINNGDENDARIYAYEETAERYV